ncbi:MAG: hypothetical protein Q9209_005676 [Squamulea sp. 1 TL-2023]
MVSSTGTSTSAQPRTSSLSPTSSPPTATVTSTIQSGSPPAAPGTREDSGGSRSINKGLAAGLGITLGLAFLGGLLFALYKWDQRRRMKTQPQPLKQWPAPALAPDAQSLPSMAAETNGQMEWEMPIRESAHEAPSTPQTQHAPRTMLGF